MFEVLGWIGMGMLASSYIPQIVKTYKSKQVDDISVVQWILLASGLLASFIYSFSLMAWPLIINYGWAFINSLIFLGLYFKYRRK